MNQVLKTDSKATKWRELFAKQRKEADRELASEIESSEKRGRTAFARTGLSRYQMKSHLDNYS